MIEPRGPRQNLVSANFDHGEALKYNSYYWQHDPVAPFLETTPVGQFVTCRDTVSPRTKESSDADAPEFSNTQHGCVLFGADGRVLYANASATESAWRASHRQAELVQLLSELSLIGDRIRQPRKPLKRPSVMRCDRTAGFLVAALSNVGLPVQTVH